MKLSILGILLIGQALALPHRHRRDAPLLPAWDVPQLGYEARDDLFTPYNDAGHEEYGLPHEEYGVPHEEYGPPAIVREEPVTQHYCPEEDIVPPFVQAPPAPEPLPLPVPILREEIKPYPAPHEEYGPPPKCSNGAPDSAYPYCCLNGVNNPSCSLPTRPPPPPVLREEYGPPEIPHEEYGPPPKCTNGAPDWAYPYCCLNGVNNPTCSLPTTEAPLPPTPLPTFPPPPPIFTGPYPAPTTTEAPTTLPPTTLPPLRNAPYPAPVRSAPYPAPVRAAPYPGKIENSHYGDSGYSSGGSAGGYSGAVIVPAVRAPSQSVSYVSKPRIVLTKKVISLPLPNLGLIKKKLLGYVF